MKKAFVAGFLSLALVAISIPYIASAQFIPPESAVGGSGSGLKGGSGACSDLAQAGLTGVANCVVSIFNILISLIMSGSVMYIVYGAFNMIRSEEKREESKKTIYYGIIGLFVMISIWGFVNILVNTFGISKVTSNQVIPQGPFLKP